MTNFQYQVNRLERKHQRGECGGVDECAICRGAAFELLLVHKALQVILVSEERTDEAIATQVQGILKRAIARMTQP